MDNMVNIKKELENIGLSEKEAAVYMASLELGQSAVQKIAEQAGIKRATTYVIIESLMNKGLVSSIEKGKKTFFVAEDPENIKRLIQKQKSEISEREEIVKDLIPELDLLFKTTGERPVVRFFEGIEGIKTIREDFKKGGIKETFGILSLDMLFKMFPKHEEEITKHRVGQKVKSRVIYTHSKGRVSGATDPQKLRESRFVPNELFNFEGDMSIYGDKVAITSFNKEKKPISILIEDKTISEFMRKIFELAWEGAEKYKNVKKA